MLRTNAGRTAQTDDAVEGDAGPAESRSIAPAKGGRARLGGAEAYWPGHWEELAPEAVIRVPLSPANDPAPSLAYEKRALIVIPCLNEAAVIAGVVARMLQDDGLVDP